MSLRALCVVLGPFWLAGCAAETKPPPKVEMIQLPPDPPPSRANGNPPGEAAANAVEDAGDPHHVELAVGAIATLPVGDVKSFSVANSNIDVRMSPGGKTFLVAGKKKGRCDLLLIHRDGSQEIVTIEVFDR